MVEASIQSWKHNYRQVTQNLRVLNLAHLTIVGSKYYNRKMNCEHKKIKGSVRGKLTVPKGRTSGIILENMSESGL